MTTILRVLLFSVMLLAVLGTFLKTLANLASIPNVVPTIRDITLIAIAFVGLISGDVFKSLKMLIGTSMIVMTLFIYLLIASIEDMHFAGLYFIRMYILPLFFAVALNGAMRHLTSDQMRRMIQATLIFSFVLVVSAIVFYIVSLIDRTLMVKLMGDGELATAWYISGGTWMRMGLPATGPNSLGFILAANIVVIVSLLESKAQPRNFWVLSLLALTVIGLLLTFSRSSWLLVMSAVLIIYINRSKLQAMRGIIIFGFVAGALTAVALGILSLTDPRAFDQITLWLELNLSGQDPSMVGHINTFRDAWDNLSRYYLHGYPKGTVGPKAQFFTASINHVENSFLGLIYDMGLPLTLLFLLGWATLLAEFYVTRAQLALMFGFFVCGQFLPYFFEPDALIYLLFAYALIGIGAQQGNQDKSSTAANAAPLPPLNAAQRSPAPAAGFVPRRVV